jgi:hypothetical protein
MDQGRLAGLMEAQAGGQFVILGMRLVHWGSELHFDGRYAPGEGAPIRFLLRLTDCREIQWRVYAHLLPLEDQTLEETGLVNLRLGDSNHRRPLHMLTEAFGLTVSYGALVVVRQVALE